MLTYRKANINDAETLAKIRREFLNEVKNLSKTESAEMESANKIYFDSALKDNSFIAWLALDGENIIATSGLSFFLVPPSPGCPNGKTAYIMNMYTIPNYRKQGICTELLKRTIEEAQTLGYKKITLDATECGRKLYEKLGFENVNNNMVYYIK